VTPKHSETVLSPCIPSRQLGNDHPTVNSLWQSPHTHTHTENLNIFHRPVSYPGDKWNLLNFRWYRVLWEQSLAYISVYGWTLSWTKLHEKFGPHHSVLKSLLESTGWGLNVIVFVFNSDLINRTKCQKGLHRDFFLDKLQGLRTMSCSSWADESNACTQHIITQQSSLLQTYQS